MPKQTALRRRQYGTGGLHRLKPDAKDGRLRWRLTVPVLHEDDERETLTRNVVGTEAEAKRALKEFRKDIEDGRFSNDKGKTFTDLLGEFLGEVKRSKSQTTHELYTRMLRLHAEPILGSMRVRNIEAKHIRRVLDSARNVSRTEKKGEELSGRSKRNVRTYLHAAFAFAQKEEIVKRNVVEQVQSPRDEYVERIAVDFALAQTILDETSRADDDLRFIVPFALGSGLRRGEICGLRWGDVDLDTGYVTVRRAAKNVGRKGERKVIIGPTKTRSSNRTIPVFECALVALREHRKVQRERDMALGLGKRGDDAPVFDMLGDAEASLYGSWLPEERKRRALFDPNEMSRLWTRFVRARKLPEGLRFHDLRHGAASMMFASGADLKTVSVWLGHSSVAVTAAIYVRHLNQSLFEDSTKKVDAMLRKQRTVAVNA